VKEKLIMKKVRYVAKMIVEFEVEEDFGKDAYPEGLDEEALRTEMETDVFHEIFQGELKSYEAEGFVIEDGKVTAKHKKVYE